MAEIRATEAEPTQPRLTVAAAYRRFAPRLLVGIALLGLGLGGWFWWRGDGGSSHLAWTLGTLPVLLALFGQIITSLRHGDVGLDVVAALSMSAALVFGETLAGNVVALMYSGGQLLESFAEGRARREMTALLGRVAFSAMRYRDHSLEEVPIATLHQGDRLLIRQGEVVPVDGHVADGVAVLDLSALTGESIPKSLSRGGEVMSGSTLVGAAFDLIASRPAAESTYAGIVRLVEAAQASKRNHRSNDEPQFEVPLERANPSDEQRTLTMRYEIVLERKADGLAEALDEVRFALGVPRSHDRE